MQSRCPPRESDPSPSGFVTPSGAPAWAKAVLGFTFPGVFLVYLAQTAVGIGAHSEGPATVVGLGLLAAFCACYLLALAEWNGPITGVVSRRGWFLFGTMIALTVAVAPLAHEDVWVMYVFICSLAVGMFQARGLVVVFASTLLAMYLPPAIPAWHAGVQWDPAFTIPLISLALYAFFAVIRANAEISEARGEIARLAAEGERSRIARDLHDLLGHSLTSITVKASLARRVSAHDPARAAAEIAEVESLAREALADVRSAVGGYRDVTLATELATGREVLRAAGIDAQFPGAVDVVDPAHRELFGWVVREGVTNVVRHARATRCTVVVGRSTLTVSDDGIGADLDGADAPDGGGRDGSERTARDRSGNGLSGLRERVESAGGTLLVGPDPHRGWRVSVAMDADREGADRESDGRDGGPAADATPTAAPSATSTTSGHSGAAASRIST
jgi:two-component system sensor histidine kinase DesK